MQNIDVQIDRAGHLKWETFHVIIERTLITPSDPPNATRGPSLVADLARNSILQQKHPKFFRESEQINRPAFCHTGISE